MSEHSPQPYRTPTEVDDQAENKLVISRVAIWAGVAMMAAGLIVYQRFQSKQVTLPKVLPTPYYLFDDLADVGSQRTYTVQVPYDETSAASSGNRNDEQYEVTP